MKVYYIQLRHDKGVMTLAVTAKNKKSALRQVIDSQGRPLKVIMEIGKATGFNILRRQ